MVGVTLHQHSLSWNIHLMSPDNCERMDGTKRKLLQNSFKTWKIAYLAYIPYLFEYKSHPHIWHKKLDKSFLNIINSLQLHHKNLKNIEVITAVTVLI